jgi:hypothetical protein
MDEASSGRTGEQQDERDARSPGPSPWRARLPGLILAFFLAWFAVHLVWTIARTGYLEQESLYYAEVAERIAGGEGATSLADRRGYAAGESPWPQPFRASSWWPYVLVVPHALTGLPAWRVGQGINLLAFLGSVVAFVWLLRRAVPDLPAAFAVLVGCLALSTRWAVRTAVVNESDGVSLLLTILLLHVLVTVVRRRGGGQGAGPRASLLADGPVLWGAVGLLFAMSFLVRMQNIALLAPIGWLVLGGLGPVVRAFRVPILLAGVVFGLWLAMPNALEGLQVFLDPGERASYVRTMRWFAPAGLIGLAVGLFSPGRRPFVLPFVWLAVGHLLLLLKYPDPGQTPPWLFSIRHGLPLHLANAVGVAVTGAWIVRFFRSSRRPDGRPTPVAYAIAGFGVLTLVGATIDNLPRANRLLRRWDERTQHTALREVVAYLDEHPLPEGAVLAAWDCDVFAYFAKVRTMHLRRFRADDPVSVRNLRERATHVLFVLWDSDMLEVRLFQDAMKALCAEIEPGSHVLYEKTAPGSRVVLLELPRPAGVGERPR